MNNADIHRQLHQNQPSLYDDLRIQREFSLTDLESKKMKILNGIKKHFCVLRMKIPKNLANETMGSLFERGVFSADAPEITCVDSILALDGTSSALKGANALQSTIREHNFLKPTPKFDDISAISIDSKGAERKKKVPVRGRLNFTSASKNSPYKSLTKSRLISAGKKRKASILTPCKPSQVVPVESKMEIFNHEKFINQFNAIRIQSIERITEEKENLKERIKNNFDELRKKAPSLEKEYTVYRDSGELEKFFTKHCKL